MNKYRIEMTLKNNSNLGMTTYCHNLLELFLNIRKFVKSNWDCVEITKKKYHTKFEKFVDETLDF